MRELTSRTKSISMEQRIVALNRFLMGWLGYFWIASAKTHCEELDKWIRKRLRTSIRILRNLGIPEQAVCMMANSRLGNWEISRVTNKALGNSYWERQGLKSLLSRYPKLC
ncbi:group II intron maturase-specific domain-containing protein [Paenibacillus sp. PL2-23]|uniref:group II intron maturase-specific domain-containing protein n=1 Tax=Paenibacillus sp. PL2-23 TaxID=2100729 RepID=UPI0030F55137